MLVLLGIFLRSMGRPQTNCTFEDTLSQIGLGYVFLFLLGLAERSVAVGGARRDPRRLLGGVRAVSAAAGRTSTMRRSGVPADWPHSTGWRLRRALEQEQQPGLGVRHVVPEPVSRGRSRSRTTAAATRR